MGLNARPSLLFPTPFSNIQCYACRRMIGKDEKKRRNKRGESICFVFAVCIRQGKHAWSRSERAADNLMWPFHAWRSTNTKKSNLSASDCVLTCGALCMPTQRVTGTYHHKNYSTLIWDDWIYRSSSTNSGMEVSHVLVEMFAANVPATFSLDKSQKKATKKKEMANVYQVCLSSPPFLSFLNWGNSMATFVISVWVCAKNKQLFSAGHQGWHLTIMTPCMPIFITVPETWKMAKQEQQERRLGNIGTQSNTRFS